MFLKSYTVLTGDCLPHWRLPSGHRWVPSPTVVVSHGAQIVLFRGSSNLAAPSGSAPFRVATLPHLFPKHDRINYRIQEDQWDWHPTLRHLDLANWLGFQNLTLLRRYDRTTPVPPSKVRLEA